MSNPRLPEAEVLQNGRLRRPPIVELLRGIAAHDEPWKDVGLNDVLRDAADEIEALRRLDARRQHEIEGLLADLHRLRREVRRGY